MGFTVEDMLLVSKARYQMKQIAGKKGWSNSISWLLMLEDITIVQRFSGKELAVTTGLGFQTEEKLLRLTRELVRSQASGLIVNTGCYIHKIPQSVLDFADENSLPLLTVPWDVEIAEMIKDLSIRIFLQGSTDEQISEAFIEAIKSPENSNHYGPVLLPHFDTEGDFQALVLHEKGLGEMDTVERKRIGYRLQLALQNLTHNGHFFYYDSDFVVIMNAVRKDLSEGIIRDFRENMKKRIPDQPFVIGVGSILPGIKNLHYSYARARAAARMAMRLIAADTCARSTDTSCQKPSAGSPGMPASPSPGNILTDFLRGKEPNTLQTGNPCLVSFDQMGILRLFYMVSDPSLLHQYAADLLQPLIEYDKKHSADFIETLENYLKYGGSIQKVAEVMYIHRNTISYRMNHIRELLKTPLDSEEERLACLAACLIYRMIS